MKRCGWNVFGRGKPEVKWTAQADVAKGRETPRKVLSFERVPSRIYSEGEAAFVGG